MSARGVVHSINVSRGGVPKLPVDRAMLRRTGVEGDRQRHLNIHGGPDRAVTLFSLERIVALQKEGHSIAPGSTGENLTIAGIDWDLVVPGARLSMGEAEIEITAFAIPCKNIASSFVDGRIGRISDKAVPGWSRTCARVLREGNVSVGDAVMLMSADSERK